jgi:hypothetical protein
VNDESRPEAALEDLAGGSINTHSTADLPDAAEHFRGAYAVLVRGKTVRRHLYLNLPAAERAERRARLRGDHADLLLVQLVPVDSRKSGHEVRRPAGTDEALMALDDAALTDGFAAGGDL